MKIIIKNEFENDYQTRPAGEVLRTKIVKALVEGEKVSVDYSHIIIASVSFIDESLVKLKDEEQISRDALELLTLESIYKKDLELFNTMTKNNQFYDKMIIRPR